ncbi:hypothetical protein [Citreimonas sp.]|uniref:hypothetical protein n=1 Tax=Citreimonas sp. TaxID=3036715 RepID=UPI00405806C0
MSPRDSTADADALWYARQVVADARDHDDATVVTACRTVEAQSDDEDEIDLAKRLRTFIRGSWSDDPS